VPEAVIDGETGMLARTGDHAGLAGALRSILASRPLQERLGANGRHRVETEYALSRQAERYAALYRELKDRAPAGTDHGRWEGEHTRDFRS
jgi:glycosyltransferase involved in cell wall biosynthesis